MGYGTLHLLINRVYSYMLGPGTWLRQCNLHPGSTSICVEDRGSNLGLTYHAHPDVQRDQLFNCVDVMYSLQPDGKVAAKYVTLVMYRTPMYTGDGVIVRQQVSDQSFLTADVRHLNH